MIVLFEPEKSLIIVAVGIHAGLVTAGTVRNCAVPMAAIGQILLSSIPMAVACILSCNFYLAMYAANIIFYLFGAVTLVKTLHRQTLQLLVKEKEKSDLVDRLENAKQDLEVINQHLETLVATDALTGVANRRSFDLAAAREWRHSARERAPMSLLMIDVDHFKAFNNRYGHQAGDTCLREVAATAAAVIRRPRDVLARYGGEEFAVVLPATSLEAAMQIAQDVLMAVSGCRVGHDASPSGYVSVSIGGACRVPNKGDSVESLTAAADAALYAAKRGGRNRIHAADTQQAMPPTAPTMAVAVH